MYTSTQYEIARELGFWIAGRGDPCGIAKTRADAIFESTDWAGKGVELGSNLWVNAGGFDGSESGTEPRIFF